MSDFHLEGGAGVLIRTGEKYCPSDILVTSEKLDDPLTEQAALIEQIKTVLAGKRVSGAAKPEQEKTVEITENGEYEIVPDEGYVLSRVVVTVDVAGGDPDLPPGYHKVDYIQFTGTQFVDTGIIGNQDTRIRVAFAWNDSIQRHIFGCVSADNTASITSYMNGSWRFGAKSATKTVAKNNPDMLYIGEVSSTRIAITGSSTAISDVADFETVGTLLLGGARDSDGSLPSVGINGKVAEFRIWSVGELVLHLVPVTDGTVFRFWDIVGRKFHDSITDTPLGGGYW